MSEKEEREHLARVKALPCWIRNHECGGEIQAHHLTDGGRRLGHYYTIPLCHYHHHWDSPLPIGQAYHKGTKPWVKNHGDQMEMRNEVMQELYGDEPWPESK